MDDISKQILAIAGDRNPFDCVDEWKHLLPTTAPLNGLAHFSETLLLKLENARLKERLADYEARAGQRYYHALEDDHESI